eukprot:CAMPEP_0179134290 /NCGR_PEP_ID=MMETSP0796-20121207/63894_1 /TAXON_ID=73915 /ORGANISM="Pyrodinium bahamense, Strain pbaha01" /LENGTH=70 /DNA_ID=CAMNT_0020833277 /DNA_START=73 /DNA_END=282 /DNA_ORIENTATION=+
MAGNSPPILCLMALAASAWLLLAAPIPTAFVGSVAAAPRAGTTALAAEKLAYGERAPLPKGYGIRTGLSD